VSSLGLTSKEVNRAVRETADSPNTIEDGLDEAERSTKQYENFRLNRLPVCEGNDNPPPSESQQPRSTDEQALVVVATTERHARHPGTTERQRFGGEITDSEGPIAVGDLIHTSLASIAARRVELAAQGGPTRDLAEGCGFGRVEERVGLGVAFLTGSALEPNDVAPSVQHHVHVLRGSAHADAREVLAAALGEPGDDGAAEPAARERYATPVPSGREGSKVLHSDSVALEPEVEELHRGFAEGQGVYVVQLEGCGGGIWVGFGDVRHEGV